MIKRMIAATCPDIDLSGDYPEIMPQVTTEQLTKLLDVVEGNGAIACSYLVALFLQYGQQALVAANIDRLALFVAELGNAAWVLVEVPHLPNEYRDRLIPLVKDSSNAWWVLLEVPNLTNGHRDILCEVIICEPLRQS